MRIENGMVVLERKPCTHCHGDGTRPTHKYKPCTKCKGTGKRAGGRCRECNNREGYFRPEFPRRPGWVGYWDQDDRVTCETCGGHPADVVAENYTDDVDASSLRIEVVRNGNRDQSWMEENFGLGVYTVVDYGRHKTQTDEQLIETVRESLVRVQACKIVKAKDNLRVCDYIRIVTASGGYSAVPVFNQEAR